ncbi:MAG: hypothetical protein AAF721_05785 [Myxococcota bacterium]
MLGLSSAFVSVLLAACFDDPGSTGATGDVVSTTTGPPASTSSSSDGSDEGKQTGSTAAAAPDSTSESDPAECPHVDVLFVIDFSESMSAFQDVLINAVFPIATEIQAELSNLGSYHIGVTTNSGVPQNANAFNPDESGTGTTGGEPGSRSCEAVGSLFRAKDVDCYATLGGKPYADETDDPVEALTCLLTAGAFESEALEEPRTLDTIVSALGEANDPGGCNEGFHAPGDALAIIVLTDAEDVTGPTPPEAAGLIIANEGAADAVALSVIGAPACACSPDDGRCEVPGCGAEPLCSVNSLGELFYAAAAEDNYRFTDICTSVTGRLNPFADALLSVFTSQIPAACGTSGS